MLNISANNDYTISLEEIQELNKAVSIFVDNMNMLSDKSVLFFDTEDIRNITGWSKKTVEDLFNHPAFPCTDIGKRKLVLKTAFIKFFSERRCRENEDYWKYAS